MTSSSNIDDDDEPALVAARRSGVRHTVLIEHFSPITTRASSIKHDYNVLMAKRLTQGSDLLLNTTTRLNQANLAIPPYKVSL
jgi:hypothetical protein